MDCMEARVGTGFKVQDRRKRGPGIPQTEVRLVLKSSIQYVAHELVPRRSSGCVENVFSVPL